MVFGFGNYFTLIGTLDTVNPEYETKGLYSCISIFKWGFSGTYLFWREFYIIEKIYMNDLSLPHMGDLDQLHSGGKAL